MDVCSQARRSWRVAGAVGLLTVVGVGVPAGAGLRETFNFTNVACVDALGSPANDVRTITVVGGYSAGSLHMVGHWTNPGSVAGTAPSECIVRASGPGGQVLDITLSNTNFAVPDGTLLTSASLAFDGVDPAGLWQLEFFDAVDNAPGQADSVWTDLTLEFEDQAVEPNGADATLCELFDLQQVGRQGSIAALTCAMTSWNIGDRNLIWLMQPDERHPYIAVNLYRISDNRFEQIGMAWAKHGFNALSNTQCGGFCNRTFGKYLGVGCTDTYRASTNALQFGLGPRYEVDPWSGAFTFAGSTLQSGLPGGDTQITRRLQVQDADLDSALNPGAQYRFESIYIARDDLNMMNSAAWKPLSVVGLDQFNRWQFSQSARTVAPNPGFAIQGWSGARQTLLAQQIPVDEIASPDGRCLLASKVIDLGNGTWRYEYALMNIDMDRQVGRFDIAVPFGVQVTGIGFHAPQHHGEPLNAPLAKGGVSIDNQPWIGVRTDTLVRWSTLTNPLRWGTLDNFWFTADRGPTDATGSLGLFRPGAVMQVSGLTNGPVAPPACPGDANGDGTVSFLDITAVVANWLGGGPAGDANMDGTVDFTDVTTVVANWMATCP